MMQEQESEGWSNGQNLTNDWKVGGKLTREQRDTAAKQMEDKKRKNKHESFEEMVWG